MFTSTLFPVQNLIIYFTNWTLLIQTASLYCTIKAVENPRFSSDIQLVAWNHLLYSISIIFNFIVVSVYWTMLYQETIKLYYPNHPSEFLQQVIVHIQPALFCVVNSYITEIVMTKTLIKPLICIFWFYSFINFLQTKNSGKPIYSFLPWDSVQTVYILLGMMSGFSGIYLGFCYLDEFVKKPQNWSVKGGSKKTGKMQ